LFKSLKKFETAIYLLAFSVAILFFLWVTRKRSWYNKKKKLTLFFLLCTSLAVVMQGHNEGLALLTYVIGWVIYLFSYPRSKSAK
jgi:hypothetical protein